jgi:hypothetical protein
MADDDNWWAAAPLATIPKASKAGGGGGVTKTDQTSMRDARQVADKARQAGIVYDQYEPAINRFEGGPDRASTLQSVTPMEGDGVLSSIYKKTIGGAYRWLAVPDQEQEDYAKVRAANVEGIKQRHDGEKGPQTDQDDTLNSLVEVSPFKDQALNKQIIQKGRLQQHIRIRLPEAQEYWVNKYGSLDAASPNGQGFSDYWGREQTNLKNGKSYGQQGWTNPDLYDQAQARASQATRAAQARQKVSPAGQRVTKSGFTIN